MPLIHERTFRVRHYECDPYGHLNSTHYLRLMEESAFDASTAAGYSLQAYEAMERIWLIRQTDIEYLLPLRYGDTAIARTWVVDFANTHSRRGYEILNTGTGQLAARGETDWAFLDSATGRPARIPEEMAAAFFPADEPVQEGRRRRIPAAPTPPAGVFRMERQVEWRDLDPQRHVNNAVYASYAEECGVQVAAAFGWPMERSAEEGFGIIARRHQIEYRAQAALGDRLVVSTWVSDVKRASAIRHYTIDNANDGSRVARLRSLYAWVDLAAGRPKRIPEHFLADFAANIV